MQASGWPRLSIQCRRGAHSTDGLALKNPQVPRVSQQNVVKHIFDLLFADDILSMGCHFGRIQKTFFWDTIFLGGYKKKVLEYKTFLGDFFGCKIFSGYKKKIVNKKKNSSQKKTTIQNIFRTRGILISAQCFFLNAFFFHFFMILFPDNAISPPILMSCSSHTEVWNAFGTTDGVTSHC